MSVIATCGHKLTKEGLGDMVMVKSIDRGGNKTIDYPVLCGECISSHEKSGFILDTEDDVERWLGSKITSVAHNKMSDEYKNKLVKKFMNQYGDDEMAREKANSFAVGFSKAWDIITNEFQFLDWTKYSWENKESHPPSPGRYLIYREKCDKIHFEKWNGSGWSSSNKDCTDWCSPEKPKR